MRQGRECEAAAEDNGGVGGESARRRRALWRAAALALALVACLAAIAGSPCGATAAVAVDSGETASSATSTDGPSLEAAASRASDTGRKVAMSLIGLALAVAAIVLAFRRDFKEAAAVLAVGLVCILLATPAGMSLLQDTVNTLVGS